jgi:hypothetical protein
MWNVERSALARKKKLLIQRKKREINLENSLLSLHKIKEIFCPSFPLAIGR